MAPAERQYITRCNAGHCIEVLCKRECIDDTASCSCADCIRERTCRSRILGITPSSDTEVIGIGSIQTSYRKRINVYRICYIRPITLSRFLVLDEPVGLRTLRCPSELDRVESSILLNSCQAGRLQTTRDRHYLDIIDTATILTTVIPTEYQTSCFSRKCIQISYKLLHYMSCSTLVRSNRVEGLLIICGNITQGQRTITYILPSSPEADT